MSVPEHPWADLSALTAPEPTSAEAKQNAGTEREARDQHDEEALRLHLVKVRHLP